MIMQKTSAVLAVLAVGIVAVAAAQLWSSSNGSKEVLIGLCAGLFSTIRTGPLMTGGPLSDDGGEGGSGSSPSDAASAGSSQGTGVSSYVGSGTNQGRGGFGLSSSGSGNGDEDPDERPTDYKRLGGCSNDEGISPQEEQPSDSSAGMMVPGTSTNYVKAYKKQMETPVAGKRDAGVAVPQARSLPQYLAIAAQGLSKQEVNPNPYGDSAQSYEGEEWQEHKAVRSERPPATPPLGLPPMPPLGVPPTPPLGLPEQVTSPHAPEGELPKARQMVGTPSRGKMVLPPMARKPQPPVQEETAQLLVYPPDEVDWAAVEQHGHTHIPVVVESIDTVPLVGLPLTQATDLVAQQLAAAGFDPNHEFVLAMVVVLDNSTEYIPLGGNEVMLPFEETGVIAAVHKDKVYPLRDMYSRKVGD